MFGILSIFLITLWNQHEFLYVEALVGDSNNIRPMTENEYPPVACISEYNPNQTTNVTYLCTGIFISSTHVLTVEHCLHDIQGNKLQILVGSGDLTQSVSYFSIWWLGFNQWAITSNLLPVINFNDIAIVKIFGLPVTFTPAVLSSITPTSALYGLHVQAYGCGTINTGKYPTTIQAANLVILRPFDCQQLVSKLEKSQLSIPNNILCSNAESFVHLHNGDSGGPLLYNGALIAMNLGITPRMGLQFHPDQVNVHLHIQPYTNFLYSTLNNPN